LGVKPHSEAVSIVAAALLGVAASLCGATETPSPTPSQTQTPAFSATTSPTVGDTETVTPSPNPSPTATPAFSSTPSPTPSLTAAPPGPPPPSAPSAGGGSYVYPNPAPDNVAHVVFVMAGPGEVRLRVFQSAGEPAALVKERYHSGGLKVLDLPLDGFARGVYFYRLDFRYDDGRRDRHPLAKFVRSSR
jgi:hypothetical protein